MSQPPGIEGIRVRALQPHDDDRGRFTELCRASWLDGPAPVQWNAVRSEPACCAASTGTTCTRTT